MNPKKNVNSNTSRQAPGERDSAAERRRVLRENHDRLQAVLDDPNELELARDAAAKVITVIATVLRQDDVGGGCSAGEVLTCQILPDGDDTDLAEQIEDDDIAERFAIAHWEWLHEHGYVEQTASEFIEWLMMGVQLTFDDMLQSMVRHYSQEVAAPPPVAEDDRLAADSSTGDGSDAEASADTRNFVVHNESASDESEEAEYEPPRRRYPKRHRSTPEK